MPDNCRHWQGLLAEHILSSHSSATTATVGAADEVMSPELAEHLAGCPECRATADEFRSTAAALAGTTHPSSSPPEVPTSDDLAARITARVDDERHRRDRRRHLFAGIIAAAAVLLIAVAVVIVRQPESDGTFSEQVALSAADVHGDATLQARDWGTQIHLAVSGVTPGQRYNVWLERADGSRVGAGTFIGVRNQQINVVLASALASAEAVAIGISEPDGRLVVRTPL